MDASTNDTTTHDEGTDVAVGSTGCVDLRDGNGSLSSFGDDDDDDDANNKGKDTLVDPNNSVELTFATSLTLAEAAFWDDKSDLYTAVKELVEKKEGGSVLQNPSAAQAELMAKEFYEQIDGLVKEKGNFTQKKLWTNATIEHRHNILASFFLPSGLLGVGDEAK